MDSSPRPLHSFSREDLEKAVDLLSSRSAGAEFIVVGSQAILAHQSPENLWGPALALFQSNDIDVFADPALPTEIQIDLQFHFGPDSKFSLDNSWEIEPVGEWVMFTSLPDWRERLVEIVTPEGNRAKCLSLVDIVYNKAEAGRPKDIEYLAAVFHARIVAVSAVEATIRDCEKRLHATQVAKVRATIQAAILRGKELS